MRPLPFPRRLGLERKLALVCHIRDATFPVGPGERAVRFPPARMAQKIGKLINLLMPLEGATHAAPMSRQDLPDREWPRALRLLVRSQVAWRQFTGMQHPLLHPGAVVDPPQLYGATPRRQAPKPRFDWEAIVLDRLRPIGLIPSDRNIAANGIPYGSRSQSRTGVALGPAPSHPRSASGRCARSRKHRKTFHRCSRRQRSGRRDDRC